MCTCTCKRVKPLNNGDVGMSPFVHCGEVVLSSEVKGIGKFIIGASKSVLYIEVICIVSFIWSVLYRKFHCICLGVGVGVLTRSF